MRVFRIDAGFGPMHVTVDPEDRLFKLAGVPALGREMDLRKMGDADAALGRLDEHRLLAPIVPGKIVAVGLNYRDHIRETGMAEPKVPLIFAKFPSSITGPDDAVVVDPAVTTRVDWEVELAVVVGRQMRHVPRDQALEFVFGYTVANDLSARDVQFSDGQWVRGNSFDGFCPLGPSIVTPDELPKIQALELRTLLNGELVQNSSTTEMIFPVDELLAFCSNCFTLEPGDIVLTGTPWGCGEFMSPRRSLVADDLIEVEIDGIGRLSNRIVSPPQIMAMHQKPNGSAEFKGLGGVPATASH